MALSIRTCGVCVLLHRLCFIVPETRVMPGTDHLRTWGALVMYPSLAKDWTQQQACQELAVDVTLILVSNKLTSALGIKPAL